MDIPEESRPDNQADWHDHYGDRKQMLVFIGQDMDEAAIRGMLDDCLLTASTARSRQNLLTWEGRENPFPPLVLPDEEAAEDIVTIQPSSSFQEWSRPSRTAGRMKEAKATRIS